MTLKAYKIVDGGTQLIDVFNALAHAQLSQQPPHAIRTLVTLGYGEVHRDGSTGHIEYNTFNVTSISLGPDGRLNFTATELVDTLIGTATTFEGWYEPNDGPETSEGAIFGDAATIHSASA